MQKTQGGDKKSQLGKNNNQNMQYLTPVERTFARVLEVIRESLILDCWRAQQLLSKLGG